MFPKKSPNFKTFLENSSFKRKEQSIVIKELALNFNEVTRDFLGFLIRRFDWKQEVDLFTQNHRYVLWVYQVAQ